MISIFKKRKNKQKKIKWIANNKHENNFVKMFHLWVYVHTLNYDVKKNFFLMSHNQKKFKKHCFGEA